ncbi:MAG: tetratricopeptide repeat protein, partial [Planctomycetes bacterium]|nr:tetratricopeptide repeat protein [Planctomycetota bacterium]
ESLEAGNLSEALENVKRAEEILPDRYETWYIQGRIYLAQGTNIDGITGFAGQFRRELLGEAEEAFRRALVLAPNDSDVKNHLAFTLCLLKNLPAAGDLLDQVIQADPKNVYAHYLHGEIALLQENGESAISYFEKTIELDPDFLDARAGLIDALVGAGKRAEAGLEACRLLERAPALDEALPLAASIYEPDDLFEDAAALYSSMLEIAPEREDIRFHLGRAFYRLDRREEAEVTFARILDAEPMHEGARYFMGVIAVRKKAWDDAIESFQSVIKQRGVYAPLAIFQLHFMVKLIVEEGDLDRALAQLDFILENDPSNAPVLADRAIISSKAGHQEEADENFDALLVLEPWNSSYVNDYALHLMGSGRTDAALKMMEKSIEIDENCDALENIGSHLYFIVGDEVQALPYFDRVLRKEPNRTKSLILSEWIRSGGSRMVHGN